MLLMWFPQTCLPLWVTEIICFFLVTSNLTKWDQHDNDTRLDDRVDDITKWKETLERCIAQTDAEIFVSSMFGGLRQLKFCATKS